jgi:aspartyl-tRNA(Asn)/glutamyl-tRNA(Gln) amidotransferase subunit A
LNFRAIGSDTGGSVRLPAAYCGLVGLKPTYGRLSRFGLIAYGSSLDCPGIITRTVDDAEVLFGKVCGVVGIVFGNRLCTDVLDKYDNQDSTSLREEDRVPLKKKAASDKLRVGIPVEFNVDGLSDEVRRSWRDGIQVLKDNGAEIVSVSLPSLRHSLAVYYIISTAEASSNLSRYTGLVFGYSSVNDEKKSLKNLQSLFTDSRTEGFGMEVKRRILTGSFVLSSKSYQAYFGKAQKIRRQLTREFNECFQDQGVDVLLTPTSPSEALTLEEFTNPKSPM